MPDMSSSKPLPWTTLRVIAALLIVTFVYRLCIPSHEYDSRGSVILDIVLNIGLLVGLIGTGRSLQQQAPDDDRWKVGTPLYWAALISGIGLLLIRFTSNSGWWTGHLMYNLS
ncbi:hypothetical protein FJ987_03450 [Mesorhizobium sp. CU2]|uniref:hypothetical protein n=1 Tax=unclassified Mesorhizobium TaxID=325217 RepID=UPI00112BBB3D|nr:MULTISPECIES: hypothetical protein [unclassified Mesorhizobium]TPN76833.1 hypothetical protein FJ988_26885 [Mesorhizobium sp. CU3]TPO20879.1 hypothetical protein FJ987_03450 [Mesorhizobium sp. CU2]